jgi:hypothetical protein
MDEEPQRCDEAAAGVAGSELEVLPVGHPVVFEVTHNRIVTVLEITPYFFLNEPRFPDGQ